MADTALIAHVGLDEQGRPWAEFLVQVARRRFPVLESISATTTLAPNQINARAASYPIPPPAPVTTAAGPASDWRVSDPVEMSIGFIFETFLLTRDFLISESCKNQPYERQTGEDCIAHSGGQIEGEH